MCSNNILILSNLKIISEKYIKRLVTNLTGLFIILNINGYDGYVLVCYHRYIR